LTCPSGPDWENLQAEFFRIGHLGHFNDLMLMGTLSGIEMGLAVGRGMAPQKKAVSWQPSIALPDGHGDGRLSFGATSA